MQFSRALVRACAGREAAHYTSEMRRVVFAFALIAPAMLPTHAHAASFQTTWLLTTGQGNPFTLLGPGTGVVPTVAAWQCTYGATSSPQLHVLARTIACRDGGAGEVIVAARCADDGMAFDGASVTLSSASGGPTAVVGLSCSTLAHHQ